MWVITNTSDFYKIRCNTTKQVFSLKKRQLEKYEELKQRLIDHITDSSLIPLIRNKFFIILLKSLPPRLMLVIRKSTLFTGMFEMRTLQKQPNHFTEIGLNYLHPR